MFQVIDEADRLLNQSFQDWLSQVISCLKPSSSVSAESNGCDHDAVAPSFLDARWPSTQPTAYDLGGTRPETQKLLFSATLTRDPSKISALQLQQPVYVAVRDSNEPVTSEFTLPSTLREHLIVTPSSTKPLALFHLFHNVHVRQALCFTKSVESASRLLKLIEYFESVQTRDKPLVVKMYSSDLPSSERSRILSDFKKGDVHLCVLQDYFCLLASCLTLSIRSDSSALI
jgi:ATP-dependent RNA helicase DDX51/DBP6